MLCLTNLIENSVHFYWLQNRIQSLFKQNRKITQQHGKIDNRTDINCQWLLENCNQCKFDLIRMNESIKIEWNHFQLHNIVFDLKIALFVRFLQLEIIFLLDPFAIRQYVLRNTHPQSRALHTNRFVTGMKAA